MVKLTQHIHFYLKTEPISSGQILSTHLNDYDYKLDYTEKDGYCFISSLRKCLLHDHSEMYSNDVIGHLIYIRNLQQQSVLQEILLRKS